MVPYIANRTDNDTTMIFARTISGITRYELNCTFEQFNQGAKAYHKGALIQEAFPFLNMHEREFLISGLTPEMFDDIFGTEEL